VTNIGIVDKILGGCDDFGETGLVVGSKQRRTIRRDDVVADLIAQGRVFLSANDLLRVAGEADIAAGIIFQDLRLDVRTGEIGRRVHVGAEADDRNRLVDIRGNSGINIAVLVEMRVGKPDCQQFVDKDTSKILLLLGGRLRGRGRVRLRIDHNVAKKTIGDGIGHESGSKESLN
jgi:hypothetical protein